MTFGEGLSSILIGISHLGFRPSGLPLRAVHTASDPSAVFGDGVPTVVEVEGGDAGGGGGAGAGFPAVADGAAGVVAEVSGFAGVSITRC
jgi:hypothetical protein